jgi:Domain of unknown function (DUF1841)
MSPKSRGRRDKRRPSDRRRAQRRSHQSAKDPAQTFAADVLREAPQLLTLTSPLDAEAFVSSVCGVWWSRPEAAGFGAALVGQAQQRPGPAASALLRGLTVLADPALAAAARTALDNPSEPSPESLPEQPAEHSPTAWADALGRAEVRECFTVDDDMGDATQVITTFAYADEKPHAVVVLVDHNLGGIVKDIWVTDDAAGLLGQVRTSIAEDPDMRLATVQPADLKPLLLDGLAASDDTVDPPVSDTFRQLRALLAARTRALPDGGVRPEPPEWSDEQRDELVAEFLAAPEGLDLPAGPAQAIATELVGYGCDQDRGQPLRVSTTKLEVFLMGWLPMTGLLDEEHVEHVAAVVPAYVRFAARRSGLSKSSLDETVEGVEPFLAEFADAYADQSRWGPARFAVESMLSDLDPDSDDADDVFSRRMFALPHVPDVDFDPDDEDSFWAVAAEEHPEYADVLADDDGLGDTAIVDGVSPRLHLAMHAIVARQLWFADPPEVWTTAQRLLDAGYERHNVLHALSHVAALHVDQATVGNAWTPDEYRAALDALPESWEKTSAEGGGDSH